MFTWSGVSLKNDARATLGKSPFENIDLVISYGSASNSLTTRNYTKGTYMETLTSFNTF